VWDTCGCVHDEECVSGRVVIACLAFGCVWVLVGFVGVIALLSVVVAGLGAYARMLFQGGVAVSRVIAGTCVCW
jgi:hypothetical protein